MENRFVHFYLLEITNLIDQSLIAYDLIFDTLKQRHTELNANQYPNDPDKYWRFREMVWMYIMTFLALSANVSKLYFPSKRDRERAINRGKALRKLIGLSDESIIKNRELRDHFEHFDARLDDYFQSSKNNVFIDKNIGPISEIKGLNTKELFRHFDDKNQVVIFLGEEYDIKAIRTELISINERVLRIISPYFQKNPRA